MIQATTMPTPDIYRKLIDIDRMLSRDGADRHDRGLLLMEECVRSGIDTSAMIIHVLSKLNFNKQHIGILLKDRPGAAASYGRWRRDADGRYSISET